MKTIISLLSVVIFLSVVSCGPPKIEDKRQLRIDDSLMDIKRKAFIQKASQLLKDTTAISPDTLKKLGK